MGVVDAISAAGGRWFMLVWHVTWQASLVAVFIALIAWGGRKRSAQLTYGLLLIALVKFALFPTASLPIGLFSRYGPTVDAQAAPVAVAAATSEPTGLWGAVQSTPWPVWLMVVHIVGALFVAAWILTQLVRVGRLARRAEEVTSGPVYRHLAYMGRKMGLRRSVRLLACPGSTPPMAFGVLTPSVIVPASMLDELPSRQVASVLAHELAHHRRGDLWVNWLQVGLTVLWWFNPLVWLLNRAIRKMREDCCDDLLLRRELATDDGYCQTLLIVATQTAQARAMGWLPRFAERLHPLGQRIIRIMDPHSRERSWVGALRLPALVVLACLLWPGLQIQSHWMAPPRPAASMTDTDSLKRPAAPSAVPPEPLREKASRLVGAVRPTPPGPIAGLKGPAPSGAMARLTPSVQRVSDASVASADRLRPNTEQAAIYSFVDAATADTGYVQVGDAILPIESSAPVPTPRFSRMHNGMEMPASSIEGLTLLDDLSFESQVSAASVVAGDVPAEPAADPTTDPISPLDDVADGLAMLDPVTDVIDLPSHRDDAKAVGPVMSEMIAGGPGVTSGTTVIDPNDVHWWGESYVSYWGRYDPKSSHEPVVEPEPGSLILLTLGAVTIIRRRRR